MNRDFKGVWIPKEIWLEEGLTLLEKVLLVEIHSLDGEAGCYASNAHFEQFLNTSPSTLKRAMKNLSHLGYIEIPPYTEKRVIHSNCKTLFIRRKAEEMGLNDLSDEANLHWLVEKIREDFPKVAAMEKPFDNKSAAIVCEKYSRDFIFGLLEDMDNYKPLLKKYTSAPHVFNTWAKRRSSNSTGGGDGQQGMVF